MFKFETKADLFELIEEGTMITWHSYMHETVYDVLLERDGRQFVLNYTKDHSEGVRLEGAEINEVKAVEVRRTDYNEIPGTKILPGNSKSPVPDTPPKSSA